MTAADFRAVTKPILQPNGLPEVVRKGVAYPPTADGESRLFALCSFPYYTAFRGSDFTVSTAVSFALDDDGITAVVPTAKAAVSAEAIIIRDVSIDEPFTVGSIHNAIGDRLSEVYLLFFHMPIVYHILPHRVNEKFQISALFFEGVHSCPSAFAILQHNSHLSASLPKIAADMLLL